MASFNSMPAMSSGASSDAMTLSANQFDTFDQDLNFDESLLDPVNGAALPPLQFNPGYNDFDAFNTFEDPFAYPATGPYAQSAGFNPALAHQHTPQLSAATPGSTTAHSHQHAHGVPRANHGHAHTHTHPPNPHDDASSPQELDDKLLGFSPPVHKAHVIDDATGQITDVSMTAELYGMFFVAEDVFAPPPGATDGNNNNNNNTGNQNSTASASSGGSGSQQPPAGPKPLELTCYRRNLWQCSGSITLPRQMRHIVDDQGRHMPVSELAASISAIESIEGKTTEIISIPWKSAANNNASGGGGHEEPSKSATAPPNITLDLTAGEASIVDGGRVTVQLPVAWKRLQFKHATANNGRRKGLQQHYVVQIALLAKLKGGMTSPGKENNASGGKGEWFRVVEISSGPVIVRGRSPRNFDSRRDVPLTGGGSAADKRMERRSTIGPTSSETGRAVSVAPSELSQGPGMFHSSQGNLQQTNSEWALAQAYPATGPQAHTTKKLALSSQPSPSLARPPIPTWSTDSHISNLNRHSSTSHTPTIAPPQKSPVARPNTTLPINLSLSEDERSSPNNTNSDLGASPQLTNKATASGPGGNVGVGAGSPAETAELLYEYFPLSLDDWTPPVDAIYRPHVVHHTVVPPDVKAQQIRSKAKRYFISD